MTILNFIQETHFMYQLQSNQLHNDN